MILTISILLIVIGIVLLVIDTGVVLFKTQPPKLYILNILGDLVMIAVGVAIVKDIL